MTDAANDHEFQNEAMQVTVEYKPDCEVVCEVTVMPEAVKSAHSHAVKRVRKEVSLPGFRKGKAPEKLVCDQFASHIEREWKDQVVRISFNDMVGLTKVYPLSERSVKPPKMESCSLEDGAKITYSYQSEPRVPDVDIKEISLDSVQKNPVEEEKVDHSIEELRRHYADWKAVEDSERAIVEGDFVDLDIENLTANPPQMFCSDRRFEVVEGKLGKWLKELLIGMKAGDIKEGESTLDEKASEEVKKQFRPTHCRITVKAIQEPILPEIDDELAKKTGLKSLEELRTKIREQLEREEDKRVAEENKKQLQDRLLEKYVFDIPGALKEDERRLRIKERIRLHVSQGLSEEQIKEKEAEIEKEVAEEVDASLRIFFLLRKVANQEDIRVTNEETASALMEQMYRMPLSDSKKPEIPPEVYAQVFSNLLIDKVKDHLLKQLQA